MDPHEKELSQNALILNIVLDILSFILLALCLYITRPRAHALWWFVPALLALKLAMAGLTVVIFCPIARVLGRRHRFLPDDLVVIRPFFARQGPVRVVKLCQLSPMDCWYKWRLPLAYTHLPRVYLLASYWNPCAQTLMCVQECRPELCRTHSGTAFEVMLEHSAKGDLVVKFKVAISAEFARAVLNGDRFTDFIEPTHGSGLIGDSSFGACLDAEIRRIVHEATDLLLMKEDCGELQLINAIVKACDRVGLPIWQFRLEFMRSHLSS